MLETNISIRVRYAETDQMGVVYHANFLPWLESARIQALDNLGYPYKRLEADGYLLPVLEVNLKYHQPARFDDRLSVTAVLAQPPGVRFRISYRVERDGTLLCEGETRHAFLGRDYRPCRPPSALKEAWQAAIDRSASR
ncbi:MAG: acyl-CoA thioesterase [Opitutales bacterium]